MDFSAVYMLCILGHIMSGICIAIGAAIDSWVLMVIGFAALLAILIYRILRSKCPCCKRHVIFIPHRWDGRCTHCGTKIQ